MKDWTDKCIYEELQNILADALEIEPDSFHENSMLMKEMGAESIDILDIAFRIEAAFEIKIPEQAFSVKPEDIPEGKRANEILTVRSILDYIKKRLRESGNE